MPERSSTIGVDSYAGHRAEQTPRTPILGDRRIAELVSIAWRSASADPRQTFVICSPYRVYS